MVPSQCSLTQFKEQDDTSKMQQSIFQFQCSMQGLQWSWMKYLLLCAVIYGGATQLQLQAAERQRPHSLESSRQVCSVTA